VGVKVDYTGGINLINSLNSGEASKQLTYFEIAIRQHQTKSL